MTELELSDQRLFPLWEKAQQGKHLNDVIEYLPTEGNPEDILKNEEWHRRNHSNFEPFFSSEGAVSVDFWWQEEVKKGLHALETKAIQIFCKDAEERGIELSQEEFFKKCEAIVKAVYRSKEA